MRTVIRIVLCVAVAHLASCVDADREEWLACLKEGDHEDFEGYLKRFPDGHNVVAAKAMMVYYEAQSAVDVPFVRQNLTLEDQEDLRREVFDGLACNVVAYETYLRFFPDGDSATEAHRRIASLQRECRPRFMSTRTVRLTMTASTELFGRTGELEYRTAELLRQAGFHVIADSSHAADAILEIRIEGGALSARYDGGAELFTGAAIHGTISFGPSAVGREEDRIEKEFEFEIEPPSVFLFEDQHGFGDPENAPFRPLMRKALVPVMEVLSTALGPHVWARYLRHTPRGWSPARPDKNLADHPAYPASRPHLESFGEAGIQAVLDTLPFYGHGFRSVPADVRSFLFNNARSRLVAWEDERERRSNRE